MTGAAGYIGSHTVLALLRAGHCVVALDDYSNAKRDVPRRIASLCGGDVHWLEADVRDQAAVQTVLAEQGVDAVIHFAARKSVEESCRLPLAYYDNNLICSVRLLEAMQGASVRHLVFSSSATVYDASQPSPVTEAGHLACASPYGRSKLMAEQMIADVVATGGLDCVSLRYFNPVGSDPSGPLGEDSATPPGNLMPRICLAAAGTSGPLQVFGQDYDTPDGTGVRDYVHVGDVADAHVAALKYLAAGNGSATLNIGTGRGTSVLQLLHTFAEATGVAVPYHVEARRQGDVASLYADVRNAERVLGWSARRGLVEMCADAWRWARGSGVPALG